MSVFEVKQGTSPVILGFPHTGTDVPPAIWERLNDNGRHPRRHRLAYPSPL